MKHGIVVLWLAACSGGNQGPAITSGSPVSGGSAGAAQKPDVGGAAPTLGSNDTAGDPGIGGISGASSQAGEAGTALGGSQGTPERGGSSSGGTGGSDTLAVPAGYELVWHDEFDRDGAPDAGSYKFETGFVRNEEAQLYQRNNATVEAGLLVIEARKERVKNPSYTGSGDYKTSRQYAEYTSASLTTSGLHSFQYGRFEMRARIPTATGMWPAWWTLGVSGEWPSNGEVDIMEFYQGKLLANVACGTATRYQANWSTKSKPLSSLGAGWAASFHVWRMDWDAQTIALYVDDQAMNTVALSSMLNPDGTSPFKQKAYMIVNLALGGTNGGDPSATSFPQRYEVDYLRVFQKL